MDRETLLIKTLVEVMPNIDGVEDKIAKVIYNYLTKLKQKEIDELNIEDVVNIINCFPLYKNNFEVKYNKYDETLFSVEVEK